MTSIAIVDTGPLVATANRGDPAHRACLETFERGDLRLVIPAPVIGEATYLIGKALGPHAEAEFLRQLVDFDVAAPHPDDWTRIGDLVDEYADFPLGGTDAAVIAMAERLDTDVVITLDRRHFAAVRPRHRETLTLLPE